MKTALVGHTGFVGSNIDASHRFDCIYNSKNIQLAYDTDTDLLVYSGIRAEMFIANAHPDEDFEIIKEAIDNIKKINAKRVVLISSVAVYDKTHGVYEDDEIDENVLLPYGKNRLYLEKWVRENCNDSLVVRLPAIYGINLKKNFIYDYINYCPSMLNKGKYDKFTAIEPFIRECYQLNSDGFYHINCSDREKRWNLKEAFERVGFSALNFTDSRSVYQFYYLKNLWNDICTALDNQIKLLNIVTEPISVGELYNVLSGKDFDNKLDKEPFYYDICSQYAEIFGGANGYLRSKGEVLSELTAFVERELKEKWG